jgi:cation:H+ antiporter
MAGPVAPATFGFVAGGALSLGASVVLVTRLERLGARLNLSETLLGLVVALAADGPEITSAVTALARHQHDVGIGVVLGSNVFNLAALLGVGTLVAGRIALHRDVVLLEGTVAVWVAAVALACLAGLLSPAVGGLLVLVVLAPYVAMSAVPAGRLRALRLPLELTTRLEAALRDETAELRDPEPPRPGTAGDAVVVGVAVAVVIGASILMETSATALGRRAGLSPIVIGALVLAAVTSLPNAVAAVHLARRGRGAATMSEALNSNTLNVAVGLLLPALFVGLGTRSGPVVTAAAWYAGLTVLTLGMAYARRGLRRGEALVVIAAYVAFAAAVARG